MSEGVDGIVTNRPDVLRELLTAQGRLWAGTSRPPPADVAPSWSLSVPTTARVATRVRLTATLTANDPNPDRWRWALVQSWNGNTWETPQRRATDSAGRVTTTVEATPGLRLRVATDDERAPVAESTADVDVRRVETRIVLAGRDTVRRGRTAQMHIRWKSRQGQPISAETVLRQRRPGGTWRTAGSVEVVNGSATVTVRPKVRTRYRVRGPSDPRWVGDYDAHLIKVRR